MARNQAHFAGAALHRLPVLLVLAALTAGLAAAPASARRSQPPTTVTTKARPTPTTVTRPPNYVPAGTPGAPPTTIDVDFPDRGGAPLPPLPVFRPPLAGPPAPDFRPEPLPRPDESEPDTAPADRVAPRSPAGMEEPASPQRLLDDILSRTGAETGGLARAGLSALTLGVGLVLLARRRRAEA